MNSLGAMKRDIAERFAATAVDGLSLDDARNVVREFLRCLVLCPVCAGSGEFIFGRDVELRLDDVYARDQLHRILAGTAGPCPMCRGREENEAVGDPEYVAWHCVQGNGDDRCASDRTQEEDRRQQHQSCGWRVMLPLPPKDGV